MLTDGTTLKVELVDGLDGRNLKLKEILKCSLNSTQMQNVCIIWREIVYSNFLSKQTFNLKSSLTIVIKEVLFY